MADIINAANLFLNTVHGSIMDIAAHYYLKFIENETDNNTIIELIKVLVNWDFQTDNSQELEALYTDQEYRDFVNKNMGFIDKAIDNLIFKHVDETDFYKDMWNYIDNNIAFSSRQDKLIAFLTFYANSKVPYFNLPKTEKMSDDEYKRLNENTISNLKKFLFIINVDYEQRTETAYQILKLLEEYDDEKQRTVFLANILLYYEMQIKKIKELIDTPESDN